MTSADPQVKEGFVIVDSRGRPWDRHLYPTQEAAERTASACVSGAYSIKSAREVVHFRPSSTTSTQITAELVIDP